MDFEYSNFAFAFWISSVHTLPLLSPVQISGIQISPFLSSIWILGIQTLPLLSLVWILGVQTLPLLSSFWIKRSNFALLSWISIFKLLLLIMYQTFILRLHHNFSIVVQTLRLHLLQIRCLDFGFIWIRCSDFICITFASIAIQMFRHCLLQIKRSNFTFIWIRCSKTLSASHLLALQFRHSDFVFYRLGVQISPSYGLDVQTSFASLLLTLQFKRTNFVFCRSSVQTSPSYG